MKDYEKQIQDQPKGEKSIEEVDPDYITGGATVVPPRDTDGLTKTFHTQECNCGKFSPNPGGVCGADICENCVHAKKTNADSLNTYCSVQPEKQIITIS